MMEINKQYELFCFHAEGKKYRARSASGQVVVAASRLKRSGMSRYSGRHGHVQTEALAESGS